MAHRGFMTGMIWAFVALAFVGGVVVGAVLPLWQRAALQNDVRVLEKRLSDKEGEIQSARDESEDLKEKVASLEASTQELSRLNSELASQVASLQARQPATPPATQQKSGSASTTGLAIVEHSVSPSTSAPGGSVQLTVKVRGDADKVTMRVDGPPGNSYDYTFSLKKVATEGDITIWRSVLKAPSAAGQYRCIGAARRGSAHVITGGIPLTIN